MQAEKAVHVRHIFIVHIFLIFAALAIADHADAADWANWKQQQTVLVQETEGIDRAHEPVECEIQFSQPVRNADQSTLEADISREIRLVDNTDKALPVQAFDIRRNTRTKADAPSVPVRIRIAFFVDLKAYESREFTVLLDNQSAKAARYESDLSVSGEGVEFTVTNDKFRILTEKMSGQIDQIDLKFATKPSFRFKYGTLHWNPDFIVVPEDFPSTGYTWWYAHHFDKPDTETESGPVFFSVRRKQLIPGQDTAWMEVYYRFYAGLPYFIMESHIVAKKDTKTFAIRNDELAFGRTDFTHAGWRNRTPDMMEGHDGEIGSTGLYQSTRVGGHVLGSSLPPNIAWISLAHPENGYAVGSIRLDFENKNVLTGEPSPLYNSHTVISEHDEGLYWFRSLIYSPRGSSGVDSDTVRSFLVDVPKGSSYYEKNAYLMYEFDTDHPYVGIDSLWQQLRKPCKVKIMGD